MEKFFKNLKEWNENVVIFLFDYILEFSAPNAPPPPDATMLNYVFSAPSPCHLDIYSGLCRQGPGGAKIMPKSCLYTQARVQGGGPKGPAPPLEIEKHLYFVTF